MVVDRGVGTLRWHMISQERLPVLLVNVVLKGDFNVWMHHCFCWNVTIVQSCFTEKFTMVPPSNSPDFQLPFHEHRSENIQVCCKVNFHLSCTDYVCIWCISQILCLVFFLGGMRLAVFVLAKKTCEKNGQSCLSGKRTNNKALSSWTDTGLVRRHLVSANKVILTFLCIFAQEPIVAVEFLERLES